jgi:hypothetical protein
LPSTHRTTGGQHRRLQRQEQTQRSHNSISQFHNASPLMTSSFDSEKLAKKWHLNRDLLKQKYTTF